MTTSCLVIPAYWVFYFFYWKPFEFSSQGFSYIEVNKAGPIYVLVSGIFYHWSQPYCPGLSLSISHLSGCYFYLMIALSIFVVNFSGFCLTTITSWPWIFKTGSKSPFFSNLSIFIFYFLKNPSAIYTNLRSYSNF